MKERKKENLGDRFSLHGKLEEMLGFLNRRQKYIIVKRYNLDGKGVRTLDGIGKRYGITRERVRQIENESLAKLRAVGESLDLERVFSFIKKNIEENGGVIAEEALVKSLFGESEQFKRDAQITNLMVDLDASLKKSKDDPVSGKYYYFETQGVKRFEVTIGILEKYLLENDKTLSFDELVGILEESVKQEKINAFSHNSIRSYLLVSKVVLENILGEWGHYKWPHINPKSVKDKSFLTLKQAGEPLHFTEITRRINEIWTNKKPTNSQTVHNELIKDDRFVLIGRGIYALGGWGYRPGVVLDVIMEVVKEKGGLADQDAIVEEVMKRRMVKRNTIILNLKNKNIFEKLPNKVYRLK